EVADDRVPGVQGALGAVDPGGIEVGDVGVVEVDALLVGGEEEAHAGEHPVAFARAAVPDAVLHDDLDRSVGSPRHLGGPGGDAIQAGSGGGAPRRSAA